MNRDSADAFPPAAHNFGEVRASDLVIAGLVPLSLVDWPGKLVASVFTQGCPWACVYCHNHAIINPRTPGKVSWQELCNLLKRRVGLLDGVVFSGGEATRQAALFPAAQAVKAYGFQVGLHTAGPYPKRLAQLLQAGLIDWVGLDIKALPGQDYNQLAGAPGAGEKAWQCLELVLAAYRQGLLAQYEVRTTVFPPAPPAGPIRKPGGSLANNAANNAADPPRSLALNPVQLARVLHEKGVENFALQVARAQGAPPAFRQLLEQAPPRWETQCEQWAKEIGQLGFSNFSYRK